MYLYVAENLLYPKILFIMPSLDKVFFVKRKKDEKK